MITTIESKPMTKATAKRKSSHGGARPNAGRKAIYEDPQQRNIAMPAQLWQDLAELAEMESSDDVLVSRNRLIISTLEQTAGKPVPKRVKQFESTDGYDRCGVRIPLELWQRLAAIAATHETTRNALIVYRLDHLVACQKKTGGKLAS